MVHELDGRHRGGFIVGDQGVVIGRGQESLAEVQKFFAFGHLGAACFVVGLFLFRLCSACLKFLRERHPALGLLGRELLVDGGFGHAGIQGLLTAGVQLFLGRFQIRFGVGQFLFGLAQLLGCRVQLLAGVLKFCAAILQLLLLIGQLGVGGKRIDHIFDPRHVPRVVEYVVNLGALLRGEGAAVVGFKDHVAGPTGRIGELFLEPIGGSGRWGARDIHGRHQGPAEGEKRARRDGQQHQPGKDHRKGPLR